MTSTMTVTIDETPDSFDTAAEDRTGTDPLATSARRRAAARTRDLTALLRERPDLAGVHRPADFAVESARWCV